MATGARIHSELTRLHGAQAAGLRTILFVCTGNSIRSQMAEALVNHHYAGRWTAFSGGTLPRPIHADTVAVLNEAGIDASRQFAKHVDVFRNCRFDRVVILCSDAAHSCPVFDYAGSTERMTFEDPLWTDALAGAIVFSYKPRLRTLRAEMEHRLPAFLEGDGSSKASAMMGHDRVNIPWWHRWLGRAQRRAAAPQPSTGHPQAKYLAFKTLLGQNQIALERIARLESLYYGATTFGMASVRAIYTELLTALFGLVHAYESLSERGQPVLLATLQSIDAAIGPQCEAAVPAGEDRRLVVPFADIDERSQALVGAKAANLALIGSRIGLPVPPGFAITAHAYRRFIADNDLDSLIERELAGLGNDLTAAATEACQRIQQAIRRGQVAPDIVAAIESAFAVLAKEVGTEPHVAMRSSAIGEDTASTFAGQYETLLNVGRDGLLDAYRQVLASKYSPQAVSYRQRYGLDDAETPMCVAAVVMVDARASGVVYSHDPAHPDAPTLKVSALLGLGEQLVDGSAAPDTWLVDRITSSLIERRIVGKRWRLANLAQGGVGLEPTAPGERLAPAIDDTTVLRLADYCRRLEAAFGGPQDIEWASDAAGGVFVLQSRPLRLPAVAAADSQRLHAAGHPRVLEHGVMAAPGIAIGTAFVVRRDEDLLALPDDAILVVATAAPKYAGVASRIRGLIADTGAVASHLASVAREFGLPAIVDAKIATRTLMTGDQITLAADAGIVYAGIVPELAAQARPQRPLIVGSPAHRRTRAMLDRITPLNLTDPTAPGFTAEACQTCHDVIRFIHEQAVREMFGLSERAAATRSIRLRSRLPLDLYLIDLGGGLSLVPTDGESSPAAIACRPLAALWRGFNHPGVDWRGTMNTGAGFAARLAAPAMAEFGEQPGGESYAVIAADYLNFSLKFAFHFATIDALCGDASAQNYVALQFAGGGGSYYGRSLRIQFIAVVLTQLDFEVTTTGDLLQARFARHDRAETEDRLDQLGRLLASSKLLDMALTTPDDIERYRQQFFLGDYRFLAARDPDQPPNLYIQEGRWRLVRDDGRDYCLADGNSFGRRLGGRLAGTLARLGGIRTAAFLDNLATTHYFPLAISRTTVDGPATLQVRVRPASGRIDRAGGIAFAIRDADNYLVFRINTIEQNAILFEFRNGRRQALATVGHPLVGGLWYDLQVDIGGDGISASIDGKRVLSLADFHAAPGYVGLWAKADSTTWFDALTVRTDSDCRTVAF